MYCRFKWTIETINRRFKRCWQNHFTSLRDILKWLEITNLSEKNMIHVLQNTTVLSTLNMKYWYCTQRPFANPVNRTEDLVSEYESRWKKTIDLWLPVKSRITPITLCHNDSLIWNYSRVEKDTIADQV